MSKRVPGFIIPISLHREMMRVMGELKGREVKFYMDNDQHGWGWYNVTNSTFYGKAIMLLIKVLTGSVDEVRKEIEQIRPEVFEDGSS